MGNKCQLIKLAVLQHLNQNDKYTSMDANNVSLVDAAIKKSDLGLNPQIDGQLIRLPVPERMKKEEQS